jgi:hypothetical protein
VESPDKAEERPTVRAIPRKEIFNKENESEIFEGDAETS